MIVREHSRSVRARDALGFTTASQTVRKASLPECVRIVREILETFLCTVPYFVKKFLPITMLPP